MSSAPDDLFLKPGYQSRLAVARAPNGPVSTDAVIRAPDVYPVAAYLAAHHRCDWIIDIGCGRAERLSGYAGDFFVAGIDSGPDLAYCRDTYPLGTWLDVDLEHPGQLPLTDDQLTGSIVVCSGVLERLVDPRPLLDELARIRQLAAAIVVSTPDRDRASGPDDTGPPADPLRVREWNSDELGKLLTESGLEPAFLGFTMNNDVDWQKNVILAVIEGTLTPPLEPAPEGFRVLAVVVGHNEKDILPFTLRRLLADGIEVAYVDNWSTDGSLEAVQSEFADSVRTSRFPERDTKTFDLADLLSHVENVARGSGADWVIHHDADEVREGPWPGLGLRDSIWNVERRGFNAINHAMIEFRPTKGSPACPEGVDPAEAMVWWQHLSHPANMVKVVAWRNHGQPVSLALNGGHEVRFAGRRIFPYRFLLRHYPLRSPEHARRKIFTERAARWNAAERARGWHTHYDGVIEGDSFLWSEAELYRWDPDRFGREFLTERLTGVGVLRGVRNDWVVGVTNSLTAARAQLQRLRKDQEQSHVELRRVDAERADAERDLAETQEALRGVTGSRSWQVTRPLRAATAALRTIKQRRDST